MGKMVLNIKLPVSVFKEGDYFVAYTPALDLSTSAKTFEVVKRRFNEVVNIFFEELLQEGSLEEILKGLGWRKVRQRWSPPPIVAQEIEEFKIPVPA